MQVPSLEPATGIRDLVMGVTPVVDTQVEGIPIGVAACGAEVFLCRYLNNAGFSPASVGFPPVEYSFIRVHVSKAEVSPKISVERELR